MLYYKKQTKKTKRKKEGNKMLKVRNKIYLENASEELKKLMAKDEEDTRACFFSSSLSDLKVGNEIVVFSWDDVAMILDVMPEADVEEVEGMDDTYYITPPFMSTHQKKARTRNYN